MAPFQLLHFLHQCIHHAQPHDQANIVVVVVVVVVHPVMAAGVQSVTSSREIVGICIYIYTIIEDKHTGD